MYEILSDDGSYYGEIPQCNRVYVNADTREDRRDDAHDRCRIREPGSPSLLLTPSLFRDIQFLSHSTSAGVERWGASM
ncbi:MAG: hypothetical protein V2B18_15280, partial [Pseudomonadota bacterium]